MLNPVFLQKDIDIGVASKAMAALTAATATCVPVVMQRGVLVISTKQKTVEVPETQYLDRVVDVRWDAALDATFPKDAKVDAQAVPVLRPHKCAIFLLRSRVWISEMITRLEEETSVDAGPKKSWDKDRISGRVAKRFVDALFHVFMEEIVEGGQQISLERVQQRS